MITPIVKGRLKSVALRRFLLFLVLGALTAFAAVPKPTPKPKPTPVPLHARLGSAPPAAPTPPPPVVASQ